MMRLLIAVRSRAAALAGVTIWYAIKIPIPTIPKMMVGIKYFFIRGGLPMVDVILRMPVFRLLAGPAYFSLVQFLAGLFAGAGVGLGTRVPAASF